VLSRIADSIYWMSRYLERAGNTARLLEINLLYLLEAEDALPEAAQWKPLLAISASEDAYAACYGGPEITQRKVIQFMTAERANPSSIRNSLRLARENARVVRDRLSKEMWEAMNQLWLQLERQFGTSVWPEGAASLYAEVRNGVARFHGLTLNTMMRGEGWAFYLLGTCLERADMTARILDVKYHLLLPDLSMVGSPLDYYQWAALLRSLSGFEAYRRKYHAGLRPVDVAEFVIFEAEFPRSLAFCIERMDQALQTIRGEIADEASAAAMQRLREFVAGTSAEQIFERGLHEHLDDFLLFVSELHAALQTDYFEAHLLDRPCTT
jgi:uncharacterized alpha-E superfamily protein